MNNKALCIKNIQSIIFISSKKTFFSYKKVTLILLQIYSNFTAIRLFFLILEHFVAILAKVWIKIFTETSKNEFILLKNNIIKLS